MKCADTWQHFYKSTSTFLSFFPSSGITYLLSNTHNTTRVVQGHVSVRLFSWVRIEEFNDNNTSQGLFSPFSFKHHTNVGMNVFFSGLWFSSIKKIYLLRGLNFEASLTFRPSLTHRIFIRWWKSKKDTMLIPIKTLKIVMAWEDQIWNVQVSKLKTQRKYCRVEVQTR